MITLTVNGVFIMRMSRQHLPFHTPAKSGDRPWKLTDDDSGMTVDSYTPPKKAKPKPITAWKGSWAASVARNGV